MSRRVAEGLALWLAAAILAADTVGRRLRRAAPVLRRAAAVALRTGRHAAAVALRTGRRAAAVALRTGRHAADMALRTGRAAARDLWHRAGTHTARSADAAGWWLAWLLVEALERSAHATRTAARGARLARGASGFAGRRAVVAAGRARDQLRHARTVHVPRALAWAGPRVRRATEVLGAAGALTLRRIRELRPGRRLAAGAATVVASGAVAVFLGHAALQAAVHAVHVDVTDPGPFPALAERSAVVAAGGQELGMLHGPENREIVPLEDVPAHVRDAVIAAEDSRFYEHGGFDVVAIGRALGANLEATGVVQGGSTITQQLAKQNYVGDARALSRKVRELIHAVALEQRADKDQLLERYLNQVYFGSGAYGVAAAAEEFFRVEAGELTVDQAALLAGQIRAPGAVDPRTGPDAARARRDQVLARMASEGYLDRAEARRLQELPIEVEPPLDRSPSEPYVVEAVKREFLADETFGETRDDRLEALFAGGLVIETTLEPELQTIAHDTVEEHVAQLGGPTGALAAVEPGTGRILALVGGGDFEERRFDLAVQSRRQPGSAFKTFALIAALEAGIDVRERFEGNSPDEHELGNGQVWEVHNFGGARLGQVSVQQALVRSVNTAFAELTLELGHEPVLDVATRLGVAEEAFGESSTHGPAVALGGLTHGVSPLEMAAAYAALAAEGRYTPPYLIERVTGPDGEVVFERDVEPVQAVDPDIANTTLGLLEDVVRSGTGQSAQIAGWPVAGKTGTTQNSADAWFVGTVPDLTTAVWIGHPDERTPTSGLTGGAVAAPLWRDFTAAALADADPG